MLGDRERSGAYASEQRRLVRAAVAAEVLAFTPFWREAAAEAGLGRPSSVGDLAGLPPRPLSALGAPNALVLRPSPEAVRKSGPRPLRRRLRRARMGRGRATATRRILDPLYKPIHWIIEGGVPVGCTEADLVRLAELGRRSLDLAGITPNDAIVGLVPPGPTLSSWQLTLGAREAGVPLAALVPATSIEAVSLLGPTVLAGRPPDLLRVLEGLSEPARRAVSTVLAVTREPLLKLERAALKAGAGGQAVVVEVWAPPGTRALWTQCRGGEGVHTWPQAELLEVCEPDGTPAAPGSDGQLVWTGLGWRGTALLRLATGVHGRLVEGRCDTCGRTTPRILDARPSGAADRVTGDDGGLGSRKATGGFESVRTVRTTPTAAAAAPAPADDEIVIRAEGDDGLVIRAGSKEGGRRRRRTKGGGMGEAAPLPAEAAAEMATALVAADELEEGVVRAVAKDPDEAPPPLVPTTGPTGTVDVGHLPPVPEVGPDAGGERQDDEDAWLPETGEVDAWPAPVLASTDGLAAWQVEHRRRRGHDELVVHLALAEGADLADVLVALERTVGATQYVVGPEAEVEARVAAADGRRIVDARAAGNGRRDGRGDGSGNGRGDGRGDGSGAAARRPTTGPPRRAWDT